MRFRKRHTNTSDSVRLDSKDGFAEDTSGEKFAKSPGFKTWAERENLQLAAKIQSELFGRGFKSLQDVDDKIKSLHTQSITAKRTTVALDKRKKASAEVVTYARQYSEKKRYLLAYKKSKDPERYYRDHSYDLHHAWGAEDILKSNGINPETTKLRNIESEYRLICSDRDKTYTEYRNAEKECVELTGYRDTLLRYVGVSKEHTITEPEKIRTETDKVLDQRFKSTKKGIPFKEALFIIINICYDNLSGRIYSPHRYIVNIKK